jgi:hypothetical protein
MAAVIFAESARRALYELIVTHRLPAVTKSWVRESLRKIEQFPLAGVALPDPWAPWRVWRGPWPRMLFVYEYDADADEVGIVSVEDSRTSASPLNA